MVHNSTVPDKVKKIWSVIYPEYSPPNVTQNMHDQSNTAGLRCEYCHFMSTHLWFLFIRGDTDTALSCGETVWWTTASTQPMHDPNKQKASPLRCE